jgi:splicing factor 3B subunit 4
MARYLHQNKEATLYVGDLSDHVTEEILLELFMQVGPVAHVNIPRDRVTNRASGYGFVEFRTEEDARYAATIMDGIRLFGTPIKTGATPSADGEVDVGAKLYIGNLAPDVFDVALHSVFSKFGNVQTCRVVIDPTTGKSRGHGFVSYDNFESADEARKVMNGQFICNHPITVTYAYKAESKRGERHGDRSERLVAPSTAAAAAAKKRKSHISTGNA